MEPRQEAKATGSRQVQESPAVRPYGGLPLPATAPPRFFRVHAGRRCAFAHVPHPIYAVSRQPLRGTSQATGGAPCVARSDNRTLQPEPLLLRTSDNRE